MSTFNLYYKTQLTSKVSLLPNQMTANLDDFILENLSTKMLSKTSEHGIVLKINHIIDYGIGIIDKSNFTGSAEFNVKYECLLCHPENNLEIICTVDNLFMGFIIGSNGPITVNILTNMVDVNKFEVVGDSVKYLPTGKQLVTGDLIRVTIINIQSNMGEPTIHVIAKLNDIATDAEIKRYKSDLDMVYGNQTLSTSAFI